MQNHKQALARAAQQLHLRSAILLGTALGGVLAGVGPVLAQTTCQPSVDCNNSTPSSVGLIVGTGTYVPTLTNSSTITTSSTDAISNSGVIGALDNSGSILATNANGIANNGTIGELVNTGSITSSAGGYDITNSNIIYTLIDAGQSINASNQTLINNTGSLLANEAALSINNTGTIGLLISTGISNNFSGATVINNGTITGTPITASGTGTVEAPLTAGIYNGPGGSLVLGNQGDINAATFGLYNAGTVTLLENAGTIAATSFGGTGIFNTTANTITALINSGSISGGTDGTGIDNSGSITTLDNNGTISGATNALYLASTSTLGAFTNSGVIAGNIDNESHQALTIVGASGGSMGTLTGYDGATGELTSSQTGIIFTSGALLLNDNIFAPSITDTNARLLVDGNIRAFTALAITGGELEVGDADHGNANLTGDVNVSGAGFLSGQGTITGNVMNDAIIAPTGPTGTLTINGNYTQNNDGVLTIMASPSGTSALKVSGTASLAGNLVLIVNRQSLFTVGARYVILQAQKISGSGLVFNPAAYSNTFDTVWAEYLIPNLITSATNVTLELDPKEPAFASGHFYPASLYAQTNALQNALAAPLDPEQSDFTVARGYWLHAIGGFGSANGSDFNNEGFVVGRGFTLSPHLTIGGAISNLYTNSTDDASNSSVRGISFGALVYGIYTAQRLSVAGSMGGGHIGNNLDRYIPALDWHTKSASNGAYEGAAVRAQYNLLATDSSYFLAPYATASYLHTGVGSAQETNAGLLNLRYNGITTDVAQMGGGVRAGYSLPVKPGRLTLWGSLGGIGTIGNPRVAVTENLGQLTNRTSALAAPVGAFTPGLGVRLQGNTAWRASMGWNGQFGSATNAQSFTLQLGARW